MLDTASALRDRFRPATDTGATAAAGSALPLVVAAQLPLICCGAMQVAQAQVPPEGPVAFDLQHGFNPQAVLRISVRGGLVLTAEAVKELAREDVAHIWKARPMCSAHTWQAVEGPHTPACWMLCVPSGVPARAQSTALGILLCAKGCLLTSALLRCA